MGGGGVGGGGSGERGEGDTGQRWGRGGGEGSMKCVVPGITNVPSCAQTYRYVGGNIGPLRKRGGGGGRVEVESPLQFLFSTDHFLHVRYHTRVQVAQSSSTDDRVAPSRRNLCGRSSRPIGRSWLGVLHERAPTASSKSVHTVRALQAKQNRRGTQKKEWHKSSCNQRPDRGCQEKIYRDTHREDRSTAYHSRYSETNY